jgi:cholesterol transport system auxiliary component
MLAGCVSGFKSNQTEPQRYVLQAAAPSPGGAAPAPATPIPAGAATTVVVLMPEVAAGLDTERIALLQPGQKLNYYAQARWADTLPRVLQAAVIDALRASGRFSDVEPEGAPFRGDTLLRVEVHDFEVDYTSGTPTAHVALRVTLGRRVDRGVIAAASTDSRIPATADRMQAVIEALQRGLTDALAQLAAALPAQAAP